MKTEKQVYDLIVVGAGPTGLYATFLAGYFNMNTLCLERDHNLGGQAMKLYPFKTIIDFPGHVEIKASDLIRNLYNQATQFDNTKILANIQIESYQVANNLITLIDSNGRMYLTKYVLFTTGPGAFEPIKLDDSITQGTTIDNVFYHHDNNYDANNKKVVIFGGGDSAVEYAHQIKTKFPTSKVHLVHRGENLRAIIHDEDELIESGVNLYLESELVAIDNNCYTIKNKEKMMSFPYDYGLVQFGLKSLGSPIHQWDSFNKHKLKFIVDEHCQTSVPNFFAAGNCCYNPNKIDMIASGISEATLAINYIFAQMCDGKQSFHYLKHK